jgi:hypothetical protein
VSSGHYYAYARAGGAWHIMDDSYVAKVPLSTVLAADAYILFYQRCGAQPAEAAAAPQAAAAAPHAAAAAPLALHALLASQAAPLASQAPLALTAPTPVPTPALTEEAVQRHAKQAASACRLKRLREAMPDAAQRAQSALLMPADADADGAVARVAQALRASPWGALVTQQLRDAKRRACQGLRPSAEQIVRAWSEGGGAREARAQVRVCVPGALSLAWACAAEGMHAQLPASMLGA